MPAGGFDPLSLRVGFGTDLHRLNAGDGIFLGGIFVPCPYSCDAVSDGDVLLHALVDAMSGVCALGDIGDCFPASKVTPGESSSRFVRETLSRVVERGAVLINVDCIVNLQTVRLGEAKRSIAANIAGLLDLRSDRVNVKAKTGEGVGPVGRGAAVSAEVVVLAMIAGTGGSRDA